MKVISPTIGRKVWFWPNGATQLNGAEFDKYGNDKPLDATVAYVWSDRMVNLQVIDHSGISHPVTSVVMRQPGDDDTPDGMYCEWMPFQVGQAKAVEPVVSQPVVETRQYRDGSSATGTAPLPGQSPREQDIAAASTSPRITPADIEANIVHEIYLNGGECAVAFSPEFPAYKALPTSADSLNLMTLCILVLKNGTKIVGVNYGAIDPAQHDPIFGRKEARAHAIDQVWAFMGYELRTNLALRKGPRCGQEQIPAASA